MAGTVPDEGEAFEPDRELAFADSNERLPWLESDDDEDDERSGVDTGRLVAIAVVGMMAVVVLLGALWWFTHTRHEHEQVEEGSTIEAPPGPFKVKPASPGGREVAGTGDTSFAVAQGKQVEGRISETPAPSPSPSPSPSASPRASTHSPGRPAPEAEASPAPAKVAAPLHAAGGVGVQVGAYSSRATAEAGWTKLAARLAPLKGRSHRILEGTADSGTVFRVQALAGTVSDAEGLCHSIKSAGGDCQVKR